MIKKKDSEKKFYYVQCGDWDSVTIASSPLDACLNATDQALSNFGDKISLTDVIIASDCDKQINDMEDATEGFLIENIIKKLSHEH